MPSINVTWQYSQDNYYDVYQMNHGVGWSGNGNYFAEVEFRDNLVQIQEAVIDASPEDKGDLKRSIIYWRDSFWPTGTQGYIRSDLKYATIVNLGARPHSPPLAPLADWASRNLAGATFDNIVNLAFLLQRDIRKYGNKPFYNFEAGYQIALGLTPKFGSYVVGYTPI